eukprot:jgi/Bigna1/127420/aug1.4_g2128
MLVRREEKDDHMMENQLTVFAGAVDNVESRSKDGDRLSASFNAPFGLAISPDGQSIFVADDKNHRIREISLANGVVSTAFGKMDEKEQQRLCRPHGVSIDPSTGDILIPDTDNHRLIRAKKVSEGASYEAEILAGSEEGCANGKRGVDAQFRYPYCIVTCKKKDSSGATIYYATDTDNHRIVKIVGSKVSTIAGSSKSYQGDCGHKDGKASEALFQRPTHILLSADEDSLIVTDHGNQCIRRIHDLGREQKTWVETLAGVPQKSGFKDGAGSKALFNNPYSTQWLEYDLEKRKFLTAVGAGASGDSGKAGSMQYSNNYDNGGFMGAMGSNRDKDEKKSSRS